MGCVCPATLNLMLALFPQGFFLEFPISAANCLSGPATPFR